MHLLVITPFDDKNSGSVGTTSSHEEQDVSSPKSAEVRVKLVRIAAVFVQPRLGVRDGRIIVTYFKPPFKATNG